MHSDQEIHKMNQEQVHFAKEADLKPYPFSKLTSVSCVYGTTAMKVFLQKAFPSSFNIDFLVSFCQITETLSEICRLSIVKQLFYSFQPVTTDLKSKFIYTYGCDRYCTSTHSTYTRALERYLCSDKACSVIHYQSLIIIQKYNTELNYY